jgi:hypothetical protein
MVTKIGNRAQSSSQLTSTSKQTGVDTPAKPYRSGSYTPKRPTKNRRDSRGAPPRTGSGTRRRTSRSSSTGIRNDASQSVLALTSVPSPHKATVAVPKKGHPFSQSQLALALSISKSRPEGLTTSGMNHEI